MGFDEDNGLGSGRGEAFEYEPTNQLKKASYNAQNVSTGPPQSAVTTQDYVYTPDRLNRASLTENSVVTAYSASALNQYQTFNGTIYNYDSNFNLREAPNWWGVFDAESRLTMAGGGGNVASFTYDGLGRCVRRVVYPPGGGSTSVIYIYDGWKPVLEFDAVGNYRASNVYGTGADEILMRWDTVYGGSIYKQDRHGNVVALLDQWGNIAERYSYDAFGKAKIMSWWDNNERTSSWLGSRFMFQGREWINELGIYDYRHRMYQPELGRFLQTDPTGFDAGDMNLFRCCGDDPVDGSDPMGLQATPGPTGSTIEERMRLFYGSGRGSLYELDHPQLSLTMAPVARDDGAGQRGGIVPPSPQLVRSMYSAHEQNVREAKKRENWDYIQGKGYRKNEMATAIDKNGTLSKAQKGYWQDGVPKSEIPGVAGRIAGVHIHVTGDGRHLPWDRDMATQKHYVSGTGLLYAPGRLEIFVPSQIKGAPGAYFVTDDGIHLVPGRW